MGYGDGLGMTAQVAPPHAADPAESVVFAHGQALQRVAALVGGGASSAEVFGAVAAEVAQVMRLPLVAIGRYDQEGATLTVIAAWSDRTNHFMPGTRWQLDGPSVTADVLHTGRPARLDGYAGVPGTLAAEARGSGFDSTAGAPIVVDGRVWGLMLASSSQPLAEQIEHRLAEFADPLATAIANSHNRRALGRLVEEQTALRRVATLVARGAPPAEVFDGVSEEVGRLLEADAAALKRYEGDGTSTLISYWSRADCSFPAGARTPMEERTSSQLVFETRRPVRLDSYDCLTERSRTRARKLGLGSSVAAPIVVDGRLWGMAIVLSKHPAAFPIETEDRLAEFTELAATAIANTQARQELRRLAKEQSALRRVATLVAQGVPPAEVFEAVIREIGCLVGVDAAALCRLDADYTGVVISDWTRAGKIPTQAGLHFHVNPETAGWNILQTRRPTRIENYDDLPRPGAPLVDELGWRSSVAAPVTVDGHLWGMAIVLTTSTEPLPADTEERLVEFTALVETAIGNTEAREELTRLAEEQAALRRVATLVAQGGAPSGLLAAVAEEVARVVEVWSVSIARYEADGTATEMASFSQRGQLFAVGRQWSLEGTNVLNQVRDTGRPARIDDYTDLEGVIAQTVRRLGIRSTVAIPIVVAGRRWGAMVVSSTEREPLPDTTEARLADFTELLATAVANAESRAALDASRARIVATADATRRRIERDLHDGAQQQLLSLALEVRAAQAATPREWSKHRADLSHIAEGLTNVLDQLREIALGIHPAILAEGGLAPALNTLARRSPIPVELDVYADGRLPEPVEVAAYYVVSEALTNAAKHARASTVRVGLEIGDGVLRVAVRDDGIGGADPECGSGLLGLKDRAEALGGTLSIESCDGGGTELVAELPLDP
jgi:signal transduction histidine kinase